MRGRVNVRVVSLLLLLKSLDTHGSTYRRGHHPLIAGEWRTAVSCRLVLFAALTCKPSKILLRRFRVLLDVFFNGRVMAFI